MRPLSTNWSKDILYSTGFHNYGVFPILTGSGKLGFHIAGPTRRVGRSFQGVLVHDGLPLYEMIAGCYSKLIVRLFRIHE